MSDADATPGAVPLELREPELGDERPVARNEWLTVWAWRIGIIIVGLGFWEYASGRLIKPFWISSPSVIWRQLGEWIATGELWLHVEVTLTETVMGFAFGAVSGVAVGLALGLNRRLAAVLDPFIVAFYSLPKIALAPLFILWFGVGLTVEGRAGDVRRVLPGVLQYLCRDVGSRSRTGGRIAADGRAAKPDRPQGHPAVGTDLDIHRHEESRCPTL